MKIRYNQYKIWKISLEEKIRISGINLNPAKNILFEIRKIYGIGPTRAKAICSSLGIENKRVKDLDSRMALTISEELKKKQYLIEGDLRRHENGILRSLRDNRSFRGIRHREGLPVRGQRTKSNARTSRRCRRSI